jgi:hypothetical protein
VSEISDVEDTSPSAALRTPIADMNVQVILAGSRFSQDMKALEMRCGIIIINSTSVSVWVADKALKFGSDPASLIMSVGGGTERLGCERNTALKLDDVHH